MKLILSNTKVETPVLCSLVGGANATPFVTHSESLDAPLFLRIAPELHLKQLVIGGLDRVYEIGRKASTSRDHTDTVMI